LADVQDDVLLPELALAEFAYLLLAELVLGEVADIQDDMLLLELAHAEFAYVQDDLLLPEFILVESR
jgi:hypothetical protein